MDGKDPPTFKNWRISPDESGENPWIPKEYFEVSQKLKKAKEEVEGGTNQLNLATKDKGVQGGYLKVARLEQMLEAMEQIICARFVLWGLGRRASSLQWPWCDVGCSQPKQIVHSDVIVVCMTKQDISVPVFIMEVESGIANTHPNYTKDQIAMLGAVQSSTEGSAVIIDQNGYGCFDLKRTGKRELIEISGTTGVFPGRLKNEDSSIEKALADLRRDAPTVATSPEGSTVSITAAPSRSSVKVEGQYSKQNLKNVRHGRKRSFQTSLSDIFEIALHRMMKVAAKKPQVEVVLESMAVHGLEFTAEPNSYKHCIPSCHYKALQPAQVRIDDYIFKQKTEFPTAVKEKTEPATKESGSSVISLTPSDSASQTKTRTGDKRHASETSGGGKKPKTNEGEKVLSDSDEEVTEQTADTPRERRLQRKNSNTSITWFRETALHLGPQGGGCPALNRDDIKKCCHIYVDIQDAIDRGMEEAVGLIQQNFTRRYQGKWIECLPNSDTPRNEVDPICFYVNPDNPYKNRDAMRRNPNRQQGKKVGEREQDLPARPKYKWVDDAWNPVNWKVQSFIDGQVRMRRKRCGDVRYDKDRCTVELFRAMDIKSTKN